jgi:hypothetical protein
MISLKTDYYYINNGNGTFSESGAKHFNHYSRFSMGNDAADYNNDGQLDLITVDMLPDNEKILKHMAATRTQRFTRSNYCKTGININIQKTVFNKTMAMQAVLASRVY